MTGGNDTNLNTSHNVRHGRPKSLGVRVRPANRRPQPKKANGSDNEDLKVHSLQLARTKMLSGPRDRPLLWSAIPPADLVDDQMFSTFFDNYVPSTIPVWRKISYLHTLAGTSPSTALLKRAKRTIGLAHLATATGNETILHESQVSYSRLLGLLQFSLHFQLQSPGAKPEDLHELMATIAILTHIHDPIVADSPTADDAWVAHIHGIHSMFAAYSGRLVSLSAPGAVHQGLARHTLLNGLWVALVKRRAWNIDADWLKTGSLGWTRVVGVFHELPALMGRTDEALLTNRIDELEEIVKSLQQITQQSAGLFPDAQFQNADINSITPWLQGLTEEHSVISESHVFPEMYLPFIGEEEVQVQKLLMRTVLGLLAECTILRIWHFCPITTRNISAEVIHGTEQKARNLARQLCMASLSFTQGDRIVQALTLRMCLTLARNVFEQQQAFPEVGWCDACLLANNLRVVRLRKTGPPSLCKIAQVISGIAEAGRYGSKFNSQSFVIRAEHGQVKGLLLP